MGLREFWLALACTQGLLIVLGGLLRIRPIVWLRAPLPIDGVAVRIERLIREAKPSFMFGGGFLGGTVDGRRFALRWSAGGGQHYLVDGRVIQDERTSRVVLRFRSEPLPKWLTGILL